MTVLLFVYRYPRRETNDLIAHSAEPVFQVLTNGTIANRTTGRWTICRLWWYLPAGSSSLQMTSAILFFFINVCGVSSRLTVGGVNVCLQNRTNCATADIWADDATNNTIYPLNSSRDLLLVATPHQPPSLFMTPLSGTSSSSLVVLPTQIFCWHNDHGGGLPQFSANDDLLV